MLIKNILVLVLAMAFVVPAKSYYEVDTRPVFQQIADLEQERILLQLEKEKVQLMLDLDRMAAEQLRLRSDMDRLAGVGNEEIQRLEAENARLSATNDRLGDRIDSLEERLREAREARPTEVAQRTVATAQAPAEEVPAPPRGVSERFTLLEIIGVGQQLQATVEDNNTGQRRRITVGREIDGFLVRSISLDDGIVFERDGITESLNLGRAN
ncbi:MAG: hypothetical protein FWC83_01865 [Alphaproteobacteria bacterium]|nr:hypothetical protein [Alphaproteobacteria bacterium]